MATFNKFSSFVEHVAEGVHNLSTASFVIALCASENAPVATYSRLSQVTPISYTNLATDRGVTVAESTRDATVGYRLKLTDKVLTASGTVAGFRYVVLYNDTATNDELVGWYDYGSTITLQNTETFTVDFDGTNGVLTIL